MFPMGLDQNSLQAELISAIRASKDGTRAFFDHSLAWVAQVESGWRVIRDEFERVSRALQLLPGLEEISKSQASLTTDRRWKVFPLFAYGVAIKKNQERCPETNRIVRMIPGVRAAMFSILQPGKEIPPHEGAYCGVLRYHLGVKVPEPETRCGISVGGQIAHWRNGQSLIFDDTHRHYAWNHSTEDRVILLVDFARPLEKRLSMINEAVINTMTRELVDGAPERWDAWETRFGRRFDELIGAPGTSS